MMAGILNLKPKKIFFFSCAASSGPEFFFWRGPPGPPIYFFWERGNAAQENFYPSLFITSFILILEQKVVKNIPNN